jgi:epoxyqueuosine reductase
MCIVVRANSGCKQKLTSRSGKNLIEATKFKSAALEVGFDECRVVAASDAATFPNLVEWLDAGFAGSMTYIENRLEAYKNPRGVLSEATSMLMLVSSYNSAAPQKNDTATQGNVARYAASGIDYHDVLHGRMKRLIAALTAIYPEAKFRGVVDSAPLLEREFAQVAGLGWVGKNTMLISRSLGSYFFLSAVLTSLQIEPDPAFVADHCGTCTACLDACPTNAFAEPRVLDATKCISYLTIENRDAPAKELRPLMQDWIFGCDVCQEVCPWNRKAKIVENEFKPISELRWLELEAILSMDEDEFRKRYRKTPLWRTKLVGLQRNALIALKNSGDDRIRYWADRFADHADASLREIAKWMM